MHDCEPPVRPGDITVRKTHRGYMVGRSMPPRDTWGLWWQYVAILGSLEDATDFARMLATREGARAWMQTTDDHYEPLPGPDTNATER